MIDFENILKNEESLDPQDWNEMKDVSVKMVNDMFRFLQNVGDRPVWQKTEHQAKENLRLSPQNLPETPGQIYEQYLNNILPFVKGNIHPRYWSWVEGTGTPLTMMADMLASGMNPNCNNADHSAMYVEEQVIEWLKNAFNVSQTASGTLVGGTSLATLTGLLVARNSFTNQAIRKKGIRSLPSQLVLYASSEAHSCIEKAADVMGLGTDALRKIQVNKKYEMSIAHLKQAIESDKKEGFTPFCIVGTIGTIRTGAIDPLNELNSICKKENLWFHIDGAFGAFAKLVPEFSQALKAMEDADSIGFDLHKWMSIPYGIGCLLVKNKEEHRKSFATEADYLVYHERGLAAGPDPLSNYGIEMSRGFKSLKVWMSVKEHGIEKFARIIRQNIAQVFYLEHLIKRESLLELLSPVSLNIVCFRFNPTNGLGDEQLNELNKEILIQLHEKGIAAPSFTMLNGKYALRVANVNHRSKKEDFETLVDSVLKIGSQIQQQKNWNERAF